MQGLLINALLLATAVAIGQSAASGPAAGTSNATPLPGNPAAGKAVFEGPGHCLSCHRAGARGEFIAPDLSNVGASLTPEALKQVLLEPPAQAPPEDRLYEVTTRTGKIIRGKLLNQDPFSLQMLDAQGQLVAYSRSDLRASSFIDPPAMPSERGKLTSAQIDDLVAYLASLRVPQSP